MKDDLCFCNDITELFEQMEILYDKTNWRLSIDPSKDSIKAVLLYNGNTLPSVLIAYSTTIKESYEHQKTILTSIQYTAFSLAASCVYGIPEQGLNIMYARISRSEMKFSKEKTTSCTSPW